MAKNESQKAGIPISTEALAAEMHDAYYVQMYAKDHSKIVLFQQRRTEPENLIECNAWRAAAEAAQIKIYASLS